MTAREIARPIPDALYHDILEHMPICCVDIVLHREGRVLLVYRNTEPAKDTWWFPGGRVLKHEKLADTARRKALEETGLDVVVERKIGVYETTFPRGPYATLQSGIHSVNVCFLVTPRDASAEVTVDPTSSGHQWMDQAAMEALGEQLPDYVVDVLADAALPGLSPRKPAQ